MATQDHNLILLPNLFELKGRVLIMKTNAPHFIFEINNPAAMGLKLTESIEGKEYSVSVLMHENGADAITIGILKDVIRWYHHASVKNKKSWQFLR